MGTIAIIALRISYCNAVQVAKVTCCGEVSEKPANEPIVLMIREARLNHYK